MKSIHFSNENFIIAFYYSLFYMNDINLRLDGCTYRIDLGCRGVDVYFVCCVNSIYVYQSFTYNIFGMELHAMQV